MHYKKLKQLTIDEAMSLDSFLFDRWLELKELECEFSHKELIETPKLLKDKIVSVRVNSKIKDVLKSKGYSIQKYLDEKISNDYITYYIKDNE